MEAARLIGRSPTRRNGQETGKCQFSVLRRHRELLLNWFRAKKQISAGIVEGFNNKAKVTTKGVRLFGLSAPLKSLSTTRLARYPNPNPPTDSGDEAEVQRFP